MRINALPVRINAPPVRINAPPVRINALPVRINAIPVRINALPVRINNTYFCFNTSSLRADCDRRGLFNRSNSRKAETIVIIFLPSHNYIKQTCNIE